MGARARMTTHVEFTYAAASGVLGWSTVGSNIKQ